MLFQVDCQVVCFCRCAFESSSTVSTSTTCAASAMRSSSSTCSSATCSASWNARSLASPPRNTSSSEQPRPMTGCCATASTRPAAIAAHGRERHGLRDPPTQLLPARRHRQDLPRRHLGRPGPRPVRSPRLPAPHTSGHVRAMELSAVADLAGSPAIRPPNPHLRRPAVRRRPQRIASGAVAPAALPTRCALVSDRPSPR